jgi:hypothetical protein
MRKGLILGRSIPEYLKGFPGDFEPLKRFPENPYQNTIMYLKGFYMKPFNVQKNLLTYSTKTLKVDAKNH